MIETGSLHDRRQHVDDVRRAPGLVAEQRLVSCAPGEHSDAAAARPDTTDCALEPQGHGHLCVSVIRGNSIPAPTIRAQDVPVPPEIMTNDPDDATRSPSSEHTHWTTKDESNVPGQT